MAYNIERTPPDILTKNTGDLGSDRQGGGRKKSVLQESLRLAERVRLQSGPGTAQRLCAVRFGADYYWPEKK